ncbi:pyridoxal phosphate-dependent aminotransferase [[Eubacterium] cellulosolvens]
MLRTAERLNEVGFSATLKSKEIINKLKQAGKDVIAFTLGEPDFDTPTHITKAAIAALNSGFTHYTSSLGIPELREAVANKSREENGIACGTEHVIILPCKFGIYTGIQATINPGDEVIIPDPGWVSYIPMINLAQGKPVNVRTYNEDEFRLLPDKVMEAVTDKTKMIILNSPSNPTGSVSTHEDIKGIAEIALDHDLIVLSDEIYEKVIYEGKHHSIAAEEGMFDRTITVNGFSKAYAMTGWRIGWAVAPKPILDGIAKIQQHSITSCTSFVQKAAVVALTEPSSSIEEMVNEFKARRDLIIKGLNDIDGISCFTPKGAFYAFFKFDYDITSEEFTNYVLEHGGLVLTPGSAFGSGGEGFVRMSYAASRDNLEKGFQKLDNITKELRQ